MKQTRFLLWSAVFCAFMALVLWSFFATPTSQAQTTAPPVNETTPTTAVPLSPTAPQFQTTLLATADTYVSSANSNTNYGTAADLQVSLSGVLPSTVFKRTLVAFDLSQLPENAVILTATLRLYSEFNMAQTAVPQAPTDSTINVYAIDAPWSETTVTYSNRPATSHHGDPPASYVLTGWTEWDVRNTVSGWVAGDYPNYGFWLTTGLQESAYWQSRNAGTLNMPRLQITYTTAGSPLWVPVQADTWVNQAAPSTNYNGDTTVRVGRVSSTGSQSHTLLKFNLSDLPANVQVTDARLELYSELNLAHAPAHAPDAPLALSVYPDAVLADWNPATVTWNNKPTAVNVGDPPITPIYNSWSQWDVTNIVDGWASGLRPNYGLLLRPGGSDDHIHYFYALPAVKSARLIVSYEPICNPPTGVTISGVTQGSTGVAYTFDTAVTGGPTLPITYTWSATDQTPSSGPGTAVTYTWNSPGVKTVAVTVNGCGGSASDNHTVTISTPPPACSTPLTGLSLSGPTQGITGTLYTFNAAASPAGATLPVTYTWAATGQTPQTIVGGLTSDKQYTWPDAGSKEIVVTAANCGAAFQRTHTIAVQSRADLPDLTTGSLWYDSAAQRVGLILGNVGGSAAPAGHVVKLFRNNVEVGQSVYTGLIPAGGLRDAYVDYAWQCTGATATIKVCADATGLIDEGSETNNCREETWACDLNPPAFISGPTVDQITEHTARITWQSSEATTGEVYVSGQGFSYGPPVLSSTPGLSHQVVVSGLQADRDYRFQVILVDGGQNRSNSPEQFFRTATLCSDAPVVSSLTMTKYPDTPYEFWALRASVTDPACMDRLSFFWDGQVVGRDYSPDGDVFEVYLSPHALGLTPAQFFAQSKDLRVQAYSLGGDVTVQTTTVVVPNRPAPATVHGPADEQIVYTPNPTTPADARLPVTAYGAKFTWGCTSPYEPAANTPPGVSPVLCSDVVSPVNSLRFKLNGVTQSTQTPAGLITTYDLNVGGLSLGDHTLEVCGLVGSGSDWRCDQQVLHVEQGSANLVVSRSVTRVGNYFQAAVRLRNQGLVTAYIENVFDNATGFQHASKAFSGGYAARPFTYNPVTRASVINLEASGSPVAIPPGQEYTFQYRMSPLLFENSGSYAIGSQPMLIVWRNGSPSVTVQHKSVVRVNQFAYDGDGGPLTALTDMVAAAFSGSDYVLVTNPAQLLALYGVDQVPALLGQMAHLASLKNGVLGYLDSQDSLLLDRLVDPRKGLHWTASLHPNFGVKNKGYMLIVGETEIVPSFYVGESHFTTYAGIPDHVYESDLPYANTGGNTARPELVVGRIIGNDAAALQTPLSLIINVYEGVGGRTFNRSHALLVSGSGDGDESQFIPTVNIIRDILQGEGWAVTRFHAAQNPGGDDTDFNVWKPWAINQDVLLFRDHGNTNNWGGMLTSGNVSSLNLAQGNSAPFGFGVACLAGNYERDGDYNLAEAFLEYGGAAYIGSTELSERSTNSYAAKAFFRRWPVTDSIGVAFNNTKIAVWDTDSGWESFDHEKLWAYEYNLYGCPKYGQTSGGVVTAVTPTFAPAAQLPLQIPNFTVTTVDGYDQVEIPGGLLRLTPGGFQTPYWSARVDYPAGQRVTAVHLTTLGTPTVISGLNLPMTAPGMDCEGCPVLPAPDLLDTAGWVPDLAQKFDWQVEENSDGSSTLWLAVYPFFYNVDTTDALFYRDFLFTVDTLAADVQIDAWLAASDVVEVGETAVFNLSLHNDGAAQDVVVEAAVKPLIIEESVDGLPLRLLSDLSGQASLDLAWDATGAAPGVYRAEVRLRDLQGNLLDSETTEFRVGVLAGEGVALTAVPNIFRPGADVALAFSFRNSGDVVLDGTAVVQVQSSDGLTLTAEFTQTIASLAPGATFNWSDVWESGGAPEGDYRVVAYVKYGGGASDPLQTQISTRQRVYLPMLLKN